MSQVYPPIGYTEYLQIEPLLQLQKRQSEVHGPPAHDEMLFIIVHQTYELWFKQILTELDSVLEIFSAAEIDEKKLGTVVARLERITEIQKVLIDQVRILETMTPLDFLEFRNFLFPASGFQSVQFRLVETKLGLTVENRLPYNSMPYTAYVSERERDILHKSAQAPSLFHYLEKWLERTPFLENENFAFWNMYRQSVAQMFAHERQVVKQNAILNAEEKQRNLSAIDVNEGDFNSVCNETSYSELRKQGQWRLSYRALHAALLIHLYRDQPILQLPFRVLVCLQDIDELFTAWRYRHAQMAHRMLGSKIGTGGSSGHRYLKAATDKHRIYSDLFNLATFLIPRSALPELPPDVEKRLGFYYR